MASTSNPESLTEAQRERIERNKAKALQLKKSRITKRAHDQRGSKNDVESKVIRAAVEIDTGSGFFLEQTEGEISSSTKNVRHDPIQVVHEPAPVLEVDNLFCVECDKEFMDSFLYSKFDHPVCDKCRDEDKHSYITKTDAKNNYLLKDEDFDRREPPLKFIVRKNPHNSHWGDMKLFLLPQVEKRALEVWETMEKLEEAKLLRVEKREEAKQKKYNKRLKELRNSVRSSLWRKDLSTHEHEYGDECYDEDEDTYSKTCNTCGQVWTYEKM